MPAFTVIDETRPRSVDAVVDGDTVRLSTASVRDALGWEIRPEGLCRGAVCVPAHARPDLVDARGVDLAGLAALLERPLALAAREGFACLGAPAAERAARLASLEAPDFTLPDLDGRPHALAAERGKKVLLLAWASW